MIKAKDLKEGDIVFHGLYGKGIVTKIDYDGEAFIRFDDGRHDFYPRDTKHGMAFKNLTKKNFIRDSRFDVFSISDWITYDKDKHSLSLGSTIKINNNTFVLTSSNFTDGFIYTQGKWNNPNSLNIEIQNKSNPKSEFGAFKSL